MVEHNRDGLSLDYLHFLLLLLRRFRVVLLRARVWSVNRIIRRNGCSEFLGTVFPLPFPLLLRWFLCVERGV